ncbi:bifunctional DNA primase/polymerase [Embleya sp. NPDC127516]|uniref:bifunctional DNA primase/polymerase n=1 Tax=Embleya sp. NPDC127516 TaxID=3363990 RepID=UPI00381043A6
MSPERPLRVLVTGSRSWDDPAPVRTALSALLEQARAGLVVVHGACPRGADAHAAAWARDHHERGITEEAHPADWRALGRRAGIVRNLAMVALGADRCLAFVREASPGATHCASAAEQAGIPTTRHILESSSSPTRRDTTMTRPNPLKTAALAAAERGWHVFPLVPGIKRPAVKDWETRATTDPGRITRCWDHAPYNIGLATGPSGLVVIDLDMPKHAHDDPPPAWNERGAAHGADVLTLLAADAEQPYPGDTFTVATPTGGQHLYHRAPNGLALRNTAGRLGWRIDTRAHGGYVVAPGSVVDEQPYRIVTDREPAELPTWLLEMLRPKRAPRRIPPTPNTPVGASAYASAALRNEVALVAGTQEGTRNAALVRAARALGRFVATGDLDRHTVENDLTAAASCAGLTENESRPAITSALNWSIAHNSGKAA